MDSMLIYFHYFYLSKQFVLNIASHMQVTVIGNWSAMKGRT
jgi:hypothetical protein